MFEDLSQDQQNAANAGISQAPPPKVDDIFAETDGEEAVEMAPMKNNPPMAPMTNQAEPVVEKTGKVKPEKEVAPKTKKKGLKSTLIVVVVILVVLALAYYVYSKLMVMMDETVNNTPIDNNIAQQQNEEDLMEEVTEPELDLEVPEEALAPATEANNILEPVVLLKDTDNDGLLDQEERDLGTDLNKGDSDDDGLNDAVEVRVFMTDPLNPDSDGDGFLDGAEVKNGYNPAGPGELTIY